jgi:hypothetical protein
MEFMPGMSVAGVLGRVNVESAEVLPNNAVRRASRDGGIKALEIRGAPEFDLACPIRCECENVFVFLLEFDHPRVRHVDILGEVLGHFEDSRNSVEEQVLHLDRMEAQKGERGAEGQRGVAKGPRR